MEDLEARERAARVEGLLGDLAALEEPRARDTATAAVRALVELYGEGLARVVARAGPSLTADLADDEVVSHLLMVHDLHPQDLEARVRGALEDVRPYMESHSGGLELLGIEGSVVRLRLHGSCSGCPSSTMTLKLAVEEAIRKAAPEVEEIEAEGALAPAQPLQLGMTGAVGEWAAVGLLPRLSGGATVVKEVAGNRLLFAEVDGRRYAYRPVCPGCEAMLESARVEGAELICGACAKRYDVRRAGRCLDAPQLNLTPVPLLEGDAGTVKVALGTAMA